MVFDEEEKMKTKFLAVLLFLVLTLNAQTNNVVIDFEGKNISKADASALTGRLKQSNQNVRKLSLSAC